MTLPEPDVANDEFACDKCGTVLDIEDSIRRGKSDLICPPCDEHDPED